MIPNCAKPVVTYSDGIGDTLMSLPALRAISEFFDSPPAFIGSSASRAILKEEFPASSFLLREDLIPSQLPRDCDCWLSLDPGEDRAFSASLFDALAPRWSVGWEPLHPLRVKSRTDLHFSDEVFELSKHLRPGLNIQDYSSAPRIGKLGEELAYDIRRQLRPETKLIVLHPQTFAPNKNWPLEKFQHFLEQFLALNSRFITLVIGLGHARLEKGAFAERIVSCEGISLSSTFALIGNADLFVGIDSGMLHVADLYRTPSVGIFGPSSPSRWGCRFTQHRHVAASSRNVCDVAETDVIAAALALCREVDTAKHAKLQCTRSISFDGTSN
jgi:ADP-heptose:LPS heptosyltransferase